MSPPPYPRVPQVIAGRGTSDDRVLGAGEVDDLLRRPVLVEEKLDGANVALWIADGRVEVATRGGAGAMDRAGQLGPLRAWLAEHTDAIRALLGDGWVLYAEWLLLTHTVRYDRLPSYLVALDLLRDGSFAQPDDRSSRCRAAGLALPPERFRGVVGDVRALEALLGPSQVTTGPAEGLVVRTLDGSPPRVAKLLRPGFVRLDDDAWAAGRPKNALKGAEAWR